MRPLVAFRDFHALTHENGGLDRTVEIAEGKVRIAPYRGLPELFIAHDGVAEQAGDWYRFFEYEEERARGFDFSEDLWHPLTLSYSFEEIPDARAARRAANLVASTSPRSASDIHLLRKNELSRREKLAAKGGAQTRSLRALSLAADQFLVARGDLTTVIAGYPWFSDWGRDTMIALPGLTLATGRPEVAKEILLAFSEHVDRGCSRTASRTPERGARIQHRRRDALVLRGRAAVRRGDGRPRARPRPPLRRPRGHRRLARARHALRHPRGRRTASSNGTPRARRSRGWTRGSDGRPVTPREGKPVEIQALWFNALRTMSDFARKIGEKISEKEYAERAETLSIQLSQNLPRRTRRRRLVDCVDGASRDSSIRPNQLFAVSLHHSMVPKALARRVLAVVEEHLLTPYGLRTLSPKDPAYRGRYEGGPEERDSAYHQGTVWPWLLGAVRDGVARNAWQRTEGRRPDESRCSTPLRAFLLGRRPRSASGDLRRRRASPPARLCRAGLERRRGPARRDSPHA